MPASLEVQSFAMIFGVTILLLALNFTLFLFRGRWPAHGFRAIGGALAAAAVVALTSAFIILRLAEEYDSERLLASWGWSVGWAFLLSLLAAGVSVFEHARHPEGMAAFFLNIAAMFLLGLTFARDLVYPEDLRPLAELPPVVPSVANLGVSLVVTGVLRRIYLKRHPPRPVSTPSE